MQKPYSNPIFWISIFGNIFAIIVALGIIHWMGGFRQFKTRLKNRGLSESYHMDISQQNILPAQQADLMFLGNSLIANGQWAEWFPEFKVANRGIRGDGVEGVMRRLDAIVKNPPKRLVLLIGINDLAYHDSVWLVEKYGGLLTALKSKLPTTKVYVQSILPVNNHVKDTGHSNQTITLVNSQLQQIDGKLKTNWTLDGLHLTGIAYQQWATFLKTKVEIE